MLYDSIGSLCIVNMKVRSYVYTLIIDSSSFNLHGHFHILSIGAVVKRQSAKLSAQEGNATNIDEAQLDNFIWSFLKLGCYILLYLMLGVFKKKLKPKR